MKCVDESMYSDDELTLQFRLHGMARKWEVTRPLFSWGQNPRVLIMRKDDRRVVTEVVHTEDRNSLHAWSYVNIDHAEPYLSLWAHLAPHLFLNLSHHSQLTSLQHLRTSGNFLLEPMTVGFTNTWWGPGYAMSIDCKCGLSTRCTSALQDAYHPKTTNHTTMII